MRPVRTTMIESMGSPSRAMTAPRGRVEWRARASSSRFASSGSPQNSLMLSMHELPARLNAQSWPAGAQTLPSWMSATFGLGMRLQSPPRNGGHRVERRHALCSSEDTE